MFKESKWDENFYIREDVSRQKLEKFHKQRDAIDRLLEDMYTSFCVRLRSDKYDQERAFKTAVFEAAEAQIADQPWLYDEEYLKYAEGEELCED